MYDLSEKKEKSFFPWKTGNKKDFTDAKKLGTPEPRDNTSTISLITKKRADFAEGFNYGYGSFNDEEEATREGASEEYKEGYEEGYNLASYELGNVYDKAYDEGYEDTEDTDDTEGKSAKYAKEKCGKEEEIQRICKLGYKNGYLTDDRDKKGLIEKEKNIIIEGFNGANPVPDLAKETGLDAYDTFSLICGKFKFDPRDGGNKNRPTLEDFSHIEIVCHLGREGQKLLLNGTGAKNILYKEENGYETYNKNDKRYDYKSVWKSEELGVDVENCNKDYFSSDKFRNDVCLHVSKHRNNYIAETAEFKDKISHFAGNLVYELWEISRKEPFIEIGEKRIDYSNVISGSIFAKILSSLNKGIDSWIKEDNQISSQDRSE